MLFNLTIHVLYSHILFSLIKFSQIHTTKYKKGKTQKQFLYSIFFSRVNESNEIFPVANYEQIQ